MPTYLSYETKEVDPVELAAFEADPAGKPAPEPQTVTKTVTSVGEARLVIYTEGGGYTNIALGLDGVSKVEVLADDPEAVPQGKETASSSSSSNS